MIIEITDSAEKQLITKKVLEALVNNKKKPVKVKEIEGNDNVQG